MAPKHETEEKAYDATRIRLDPPILPDNLRAQTADGGQYRDRGVFERARDVVNCCASESLHSRAVNEATTLAERAARLERLAQAMTPDTERTLFALQEALALGLIDGGVFLDAIQRSTGVGGTVRVGGTVDYGAALQRGGSAPR